MGTFQRGLLNHVDVIEAKVLKLNDTLNVYRGALMDIANTSPCYTSRLMARRALSREGWCNADGSCFDNYTGEDHVTQDGGGEDSQGHDGRSGRDEA